MESKGARMTALIKEIDERYDDDIKQSMEDGKVNLELYKVFSDDTNRYHRYRMNEIIGPISSSLLNALSVGEKPM